MATTAATITADSTWDPPSRGRVGMFSLIAAESAIFVIFLVAYIFYLGRGLSGPTPREVLEVPTLNTVCLLSSSITIHFAVRALRQGKMLAFKLFWFLTVSLAAKFLIGTGMEWRHLIYQRGLTITTNLFGTTYYSLVGLHAFHVIVGLAGLTIVMLLALASKIHPQQSEKVAVFSLYWHFVDAVWVAVFTTVYIVGR
jgi:cytochrome c oxidase subunit III